MADLNLNINQLCFKTGASWPNVKKLINGQTSRINFTMLGALCRSLEMTPSDLFTLETEHDENEAKEGRRGADWPRSPERLYSRVFGHGSKE